MTLTCVYPEKGRTTNHRWVAVYKTSIGFNHVPLACLISDTSREEAEQLAREAAHA